MIRMVAAALLLALSSYATAFDAGNTVSLAIADWGGFSNPTQPKEWGCDRPQTICLDSLADARFRNLKTIAGPELPDSLVASTIFHAEPRRGVRMLVAIQTGTDERRTGKILRYILPGRHEACFDAQFATKHHYPIPDGARRKGGEMCVVVD